MDFGALIIISISTILILTPFVVLPSSDKGGVSYTVAYYACCVWIQRYIPRSDGFLP